MSILNSISKLRRDYTKGKFDVSNALENPFKQFEKWFGDAMKSDLTEPTAMVLSTSTKAGEPSSRVLLLKKVTDNSLIFYTNYNSRKAAEIDENPKAALLFYWDILERQIRIEGSIQKISMDESAEYFATRPYESKLGAWASKQSSILKSRFTLLRSVLKYMGKFPKEVPLPPHWGGYRLIPNYFEFWQGRESRLHDRIAYTRKQDNWERQRLYP